MDPDQRTEKPPLTASGIRFLPFESLISHGKFPRCPDDVSLTVDLNIIDKDKSLLVFISHHWWRGDSTCAGWDGRPHPDNASNIKYKVCVEGIKQLKQIYAPRMSNCYVWMDYFCMNQESKDLAHELKGYDKIVGSCDCICTPVVNDYVFYMSKAWCRVEMLYASHIPLQKYGRNGEERHLKFEKEMAYELSKGRRPHVHISGDAIKHFRGLSFHEPLQNNWLKRYHPLKGQLTRNTDMIYIQQLVNDLQPIIDANVVNEKYNGERNDDGLRHGKGVMTYDNGDVYQGEWRSDKRHGRGTLRSLNGKVYKGMWENDKRHGRGVLTHVNGSVYVGGWFGDKIHGKGQYRYANGDVYVGDFRYDRREGLGICRYGKGEVYKGEWKFDMKEGCGTMTFANGDVVKGRWLYDYHFSGKMSLFEHVKFWAGWLS